MEGERDLAGWAELRAWQDDDRLGVHVRRLRTAYEQRERALVRVQALWAYPASVDIPDESG
jgi:hypothetical protein